MKEHKRIYTDDDEQIELLNRIASFFFQRLHRLYWISFTMNIGRYLDHPTFGPTKAANISFPALAKKAVGLPFEMKLRELVEEAKNLAKPFKEVRHKLIAHADELTILSPTGYKYNLQTSSVERIYSLIEQGINLYFQHYDGHTHSWVKLPPSGGALSVIASLKAQRKIA